MTQNEVRMSLLKRLAEQAMSDQEFRAIAGKDLDGALERYDYELNERERDLVGRFHSGTRTTAENAGLASIPGAHDQPRGRR